eukprot:PhF_6_TR31826/c0_g1_i1/m.47063
MLATESPEKQKASTTTSRPIPFVSGYWTRYILSPDGGDNENIELVISLIDGARRNSALGIQLFQDKVDPAKLLVGSYNAKSKKVDLQERGGTGVGFQLTLSVKKQESGDQITLIGQTLRDNRTVVLLKEETSVQANFMSALWCGNCVPHDDLKHFFIPTNPVRWVLAFLPDARLLGCGFFEDVGDTDSKELYFSLSGKWVPETGMFTLVKDYEPIPETEGYQIEYEGRITKDSTMSIEGTWRNPKGGSYGRLYAAPNVVTDGPATAMVLCDNCGTWIPPQKEYIRVVDSADPIMYCHGCSLNDWAMEKPTIVEAVCVPQLARGTSTATIMLDSLHRFEKRSFLSRRVTSAEGSPAIQWLTFGDVRGCTFSIWSQLLSSSIPQRSYVIVVGSLSVENTCAQIAVLLHGGILMPMPESASVDEISQWVQNVQVGGILCLSTRAEDLKQSFPTIPILVVKSFDETTPVHVAPAPCAVLRSDDSTVVLFTSGSTGYAKGVVFSDALSMPTEGTPNLYPYIQMDFQPYDPTFILSVAQSMLTAGRRCICTDLATLMVDFKLGRPTHVGAPPAFWTNLYREYLGGAYGNTLVQKLGGRVFLGCSGGAATPPEVTQFVKKVLRIDFVDLYGSRETGGIAKDGVVYPAVQVKIMPLEGSTGTDAGEICVASPRLAEGYLAASKTTEDKFIQIDGTRFYRTGDLGTLHVDADGTRRITVLGRCTEAAKNSTGQWVVTSDVEGILEQFPGITQSVVVADPRYPFTVAVVVVSPTVGAEADDALIQNIRRWVSHQGIPAKRRPRGYIVERTISWTVENKMITPSMKKRVANIRLHYQSKLNELFASIEKGEVSDGQQATTVPWCEGLQKLIPASYLQHSTGDESLSDLGMDSLTAIRLTDTIKQTCKLSSATLEQVLGFSLSYVNDLLAKGSTSEECSKAIAATTVNRSVNWGEEMSLPAWVGETSTTIAPVNDVDDVLVTGATGFLGPVLVLELLRRFPTSKLHCIVRGDNAKDRLLRNIAEVGTTTFSDVERDRIVVHPGDYTAEYFGLPPAQYELLIATVSRVYHNAAQVSSLLPYSSLRRPNVLGTLRVIQFCVNPNRKKALHLISSTGAIRVGGVEETEFHPLSPYELQKKGDGYGQSKAIAEILVHEAGRKYGITTGIYRISAISGHTETGYTNPKDLITVLARACKYCSHVPASLGISMLGWVPVDVVAYVVGVLSVSLEKNSSSFPFNLFHVTGDGPQLSALLKHLPDTVNRVSVPAWKNKFRTLTDETSDADVMALKNKLLFYEWETPSGPRMTCDSTKSLVKKCAAGEDRAATMLSLWDDLSEEVCRKYLNSMLLSATHTK